MFFAAIMSVCYYYGIAQIIILKVSWFLTITMGTSPSESFSASANIFLSMVYMFPKNTVGKNNTLYILVLVSLCYL